MIFWKYQYDLDKYTNHPFLYACFHQTLVCFWSRIECVEPVDVMTTPELNIDPKAHEAEYARLLESLHDKAHAALTLPGVKHRKGDVVQWWKVDSARVKVELQSQMDSHVSFIHSLCQ